MLLAFIWEARVAIVVVVPFANPCKDGKIPGQHSSACLAFRWYGGLLAGGYVDTQRNGSLMEKEAEGGREGGVPRKGKERKEEGEGPIYIH